MIGYYSFSKLAKLNTDCNRFSTIVLIAFLFLSGVALCQSVNFENVGKEKLLRYNGGISANGVFYDGTANRQSFTYFLNGNLNFNIAGLYNIPLSFTYSNQDFNFANPFKFNRLSLNPSYKWIAAHIGDVNMTFSPYTLAGHQFTGAGVDLTPEGPFQISAMYGRLLRATEFNTEMPEAMAAYRRIGYGLKTSYAFEKFRLGLILFKATDDEGSLENPIPIAANITPNDNAVVSLETEFTLFDKARFRVEYAISGITEDTGLNDPRSENGLLNFLLDENITTNYFNAFNASLSYPAGNGVLGVAYERIDPDYRTLGAYFFNNDFENITVNASQNIFDNKLNVSVNAGLQQDNLDDTKSSELQRVVSSINLNYTASERLGINGSYSNFQSFTNIQDQFDFINQVGAFDNVDTLNYRQISQNANLGINYITKRSETKQQTANLNIIYQNSNNQQQGETIEGGLSNFYNGIASYTWNYPKEALNISLAGNASLNETGMEDSNLILGPTLSIGKQFFDKTLRTNFSSSYNTSFNNAEQQSSVYNFRLGASYTLFEQHNLNLNVLSLFRNAQTGSNRDFTMTFGYSYSFDNFKLRLKGREKTLGQNKNILAFRHRGVTYRGTITDINTQLTNVYSSPKFRNIPSFKKDELKIDLATVKHQKRKTVYEERAITFLDNLYSYGDFLKLYDEILYEVVEKIRGDMSGIDIVLEGLFVSKKTELDEHPFHNKPLEEYTEQDKETQNGYEKLKEDVEQRLRKLVGHRWMQKQFENYVELADIQNAKGYLSDFKRNTSMELYQTYEKNKDIDELKLLLEIQFIDYHYKLSTDLVDPDTFELRYINKN
ncbi:hypothetical protein MTsPCn5_00190 [Croceitalea sp. MTPC5]|uniref:hypothetical protein n=1 Tax=Croceitalea sp. MTPC5 TaxID=3056565 RepID=UPI002B3C36CD|nr:hypothetical protein MTsPCn5_00190 [Croceitalea sp. MTPC5]